MAGMQALGRLFNVVPIAAGRGLAMRDCSAVTFITTGQDTFTLAVAAGFAGSYATPGNIITTVYWSTATNGSAAWNKLVQAAAATIVPGTTTGLTTANACAFTVFGSQLPDPKNYVRLTPSGAGLVTAVLHDLAVQRAPANLAIVSV